MQRHKSIIPKKLTQVNNGKHALQIPTRSFHVTTQNIPSLENLKPDETIGRTLYDSNSLKENVFAGKKIQIISDRETHKIPQTSKKCVKPKAVTNNTFTVLTANQKVTTSRTKTANQKVSLVHEPKFDPLQELRSEVESALTLHKIFMINGQADQIRLALTARGWIEKLHSGYFVNLSDEFKKLAMLEHQKLLKKITNSELATFCQTIIKSKLIGNKQPDFYWGPSLPIALSELLHEHKNTLINRFEFDRNSFTNKRGLIQCTRRKSSLEQISPRAYNLENPLEVQSFVDDYRLTAAISLLKWILDVTENKNFQLVSSSGQIPLDTFDLAVTECNNYIRKCNNEHFIPKVPPTLRQYNEFLQNFYNAVHWNYCFKNRGVEKDVDIIQKASHVMTLLRSSCKTLNVDGYLNLWILKPASNSCGRGIHICSSLNEIRTACRYHTLVKFVIQKYIERPFLIHGTKFDIRQYFLICYTNSLSIWVYKECYLRFASQTYDLHNLHEAVHLTNNSIQQKYEETTINKNLPPYHMWNLQEFDQYLLGITDRNIFKTTIYPEIIKSILSVVLVHEEKLKQRKNTFELFGADFILDENFKPWLLEINAIPAMHSSTPVTTKLCPAVLEDVIKVVIDFQNNSLSNTGNFDLVYDEKISKSPKADTFIAPIIDLPLTFFSSIPKQKIVPKFARIQKTLGREKRKALLQEYKSVKSELLQMIWQDKVNGYTTPIKK